MRPSNILPLAILSLYFLTLFLPTQARHHFHRKHKHSYYHNAPEISPSPSPFSGPSTAPDEAPSPSPTADENYHNTSDNLFDIRAFGAIGDGVTDDTESLKMAWDTACQSESAVKVILVPHGLSFIIQSTIFTGPCKGGLVLKVMYFANCNIFGSSYTYYN